MWTLKGHVVVEVPVVGADDLRIRGTGQVHRLYCIEREQPRVGGFTFRSIAEASLTVSLC